MFIVKAFLVIILTVLLICVAAFVGVPVYRFAPQKPFAGATVYNPYAEVDSTRWLKANFHAHQREKPKCNYTEDELLAAYETSGYDIMSISDHQHINQAHKERPGFIPTYEHGFGLNRYHQLMMGAEKVSWYDFPIMLTESQMQYMLYRLKPQAQILVLNHPGQTRIINHDVYSRLRGYDLLEINPEQGKQRSDERWDRALSAGIYSNLIGDDDAHSVTRRTSWFQRCFTMVNTPTLTPDDIMSALKAGRSYAVVVPSALNTRENPHEGLPRIRHIGCNRDTVSVAFSVPAASIRFVGQGGRVLSQAENNAGAEYVFAAEDTYVRVEATFPDEAVIYTNPFVRTEGPQPVNIFEPEINYPLSVLVNLLWIWLIFVFVVLIMRLFGMNNKLTRLEQTQMKWSFGRWSWPPRN